jgi:hypothetical protein
MNRLNIIIYPLLLIAATGCSSKYAQTKSFQPISEIHSENIHNYELNKVKSVSVGEKLLESGAIKYESVNNGEFLAIKTTGTEVFSAKAGLVYKANYVDTQDGAFYVKDAGNGYEFPSGIKIDKNGNLVDTIWYYYNIGGLQRGFSNQIVGVQGEKLFEPMASVKRYTESSNKKEVIYSGKNKDSIKLMYREYAADMTRPSVSQDLTYDLSESNVIGVKNFKIKVISATNEGVTFTVISD